jgi:hypothetical protein
MGWISQILGSSGAVFRPLVHPPGERDQHTAALWRRLTVLPAEFFDQAISVRPDHAPTSGVRELSSSYTIRVGGSRRPASCCYLARHADDITADTKLVMHARIRPLLMPDVQQWQPDLRTSRLSPSAGGAGPASLQRRTLPLLVSSQHVALPVEYARVPPPAVGCYRRTNPGTRGSRGSTVNWLEPYL